MAVASKKGNGNVIKATRPATRGQRETQSRKTEAELDEMTDERIQSLLPDLLPPPLSLPELIQLVLNPNTLSMPEEENAFVVEMMRGFSAPEATLTSALTAAGLHSNQKVNIQTATTAAIAEVPGEPVSLVLAESHLFSLIKTLRTDSYAAEHIILCETMCTQQAWNKIGTQEKGTHNRELYMAQNPHRFDDNQTDADKHKMLTCSGELWPAMKELLRKDREPLTTSYSNFLQFGFAAVIHPSTSIASLGRRTPTLSHVSQRLHLALANHPDLRREIEGRADANLHILREFMRSIVVAENKDAVREYITDFPQHRISLQFVPNPDFQSTTPEAAAIKHLQTSGIRLHKPKCVTQKNTQNKSGKPSPSNVQQDKRTPIPSRDLPGRQAKQATTNTQNFWLLTNPSASLSVTAMSTPVPSTSALFTPLPAPSIHPQSGPPPVARASDHYSGSHECASSSVTLPPPSSSYHLSRFSKIPFFHGGMQSDNLDIPRVSAELARLVDEHNPTLPTYFAHFFTKTAEHDKQALSNLDAIAKEYSSFPTVDAILHMLSLPPQTPNTPISTDPAILNCAQAWILNNLVPVALADRLAWVADPETPPPPVQQQEYGQTAHLQKQFRDVMEDWHAALISIDSYVHKKANKAAPKHQPPQQNDLSRHQQITTLNARGATQPAIANVSTLTYAVQVLLRGDPTISLQSCCQMLEEEKNADGREWTAEQVEAMAQTTVMLEVYPPLVHAFVYHAAAVVCKATICIQPHLLQLVDHWTTRGNLYSMQNDHPISRLDRTTWILYLCGSLGKLPIKELIPTLFEGPVVREILATPQPSHTRQALQHPLPPPKFEEEDNLYAMPMDSLMPELDIPSPIFSFHSPTSPEPALSPEFPLSHDPWPSPISTLLPPTPASAVHPAPSPDPTPPGAIIAPISHNRNYHFNVPLDNPPAIQFRREVSLPTPLLPPSTSRTDAPILAEEHGYPDHDVDMPPAEHTLTTAPPPAPPTGAKRGCLDDNDDDSRHEQQTAQDFPPIKRPRLGNSDQSGDVPEAPSATGTPPAPVLMPFPAADARGEEVPAHNDAPAAETPAETQQAAGDVPAADAPPAPPAGANRGHLDDNDDHSPHEQETAQDFPPVKRPRVGDSDPSEDVPEAPAATGAPPAPPLTPSPAADAQASGRCPQNAPPAGAAPLAATSAGDVPAADAPPAPPAGAVQPADGASPNAPPAGAAPAAATSAGSQPSAAATTSPDGGPVQMEDTYADGQPPNKTCPRKPRRKNDEEEDVAPHRSDRIGEKAAEAGAAPPAVAPAHPPIADKSHARAKSRNRPTTTKLHQQPVPSPIKWLDVRPGFQPPAPDESLYLQEIYHNKPEQRLDTSADHPFVKDSVAIPYSHPIAVSDPENGRHIEFEHGVYHHRFFEGSAAQTKVLQSLVANQYTVADENGVHIPISQTPELLARPTLDPPPPGTELSRVWIGHSEEWRSLSPKVQQNHLRTGAAQIVHTAPAVGCDYEFDIETFSAFTNPEHLASIQDNRAREPGNPPQNFVGRPSNLIKCARKADTQRTDPPPARGQALNLLSNLLPETSLPLSDAWEHIATHEFACRFLRGSTVLSRFEFLWKEVSWAIFATGGAMSDTHIDVLLTIIMILCSSKLWSILHRRAGLPDTELRGLMRSHKAFTDFDAANLDPKIFAQEILYLDPHSILILLATFPHWVITEHHSVAIGRHGIANSNITNCILTSLHNVMLAHVTTNADHEPAREFLLRVFLFIAAATLYYNDPSFGAYPPDEMPPPLPENVKLHMPDLLTVEGITDLLALRSFIILYIPLMSCVYHQLNKANALPINADLWLDVQTAWRLAIELDVYIKDHYRLVARAGYNTSDLPSDWGTAALTTLIVMAVSLIHYHRDSLIDHNSEDLEREPKFTTENFAFQIRQALAHFDIREMWYNHHQFDGPEPAYAPDAVLTEKELGDIYTVEQLNYRLESGAPFHYLLPLGFLKLPVCP
ncbi:hypothetical protein B0H10DRAFT_1945921 [Mycena sp. CBHHK59/15]|nr:hypothetical protein B0H10DRAFT_1945921 [Mycena sp. CBHHK59/15]